MKASVEIAEPSRHHFPALQALELAAFETLRQAGAVSGMARASSDDDLQRYRDHGFLIAAFADQHRPVGYAGAVRIEAYLHIGEIDVHPDWQRQGIGRRLMEHLLAHGRGSNLSGATLTTDRLAPFNADFYRSIGFHLLEQADCPPYLSQILDTEIAKGLAKGLDPSRRVGMMLTF